MRAGRRTSRRTGGRRAGRADGGRGAGGDDHGAVGPGTGRYRGAMRALRAWNAVGLLLCALVLVDAVRPGPSRIGAGIIGMIGLNAAMFGAVLLGYLLLQGLFDPDVARDAYADTPAWLKAAVAALLALLLGAFVMACAAGNVEQAPDGYWFESHGRRTGPASAERYQFAQFALQFLIASLFGTFYAASGAFLRAVHRARPARDPA
ncbi:hypothetical protein GCM10009679_50840 [Saccharothrix algeriensis]|uniref:Uncharacterized protein n=3 Tax=Catellatospora bangladeshensis TaxID=310355 RepID=A0A8J3JTP6_9ACTN|nr:hypothetical protein Cba03nite_63240 [Catellatospora bangladeshensis]